MPNFESLPSEVLAMILAHVPLQTVVAMRQVSKRHKNQIDDNAPFWEKMHQRYFLFATSVEKPFSFKGFRRTYLGQFETSRLHSHTEIYFPELELHAKRSVFEKMHFWAKDGRFLPQGLSFDEIEKAPDFDQFLETIKELDDTSAKNEIFKKLFTMAMHSYRQKNGGISYNKGDDRGRTLLYWAILFDQKEMTKELLKKQDKEIDPCALHAAIKQNDSASVKLLLSLGCSQRALLDGAIPLRLALSSSQKENAQLLWDALLQEEEEIRNKCLLHQKAIEDTPIPHLAAKCGLQEMMEISYQLFLRAGRSIHDRYGHTPLDYAMLSKQKNIIRYFLEHDKYIDKQDTLMFAVQSATPEIFEIFLQTLNYDRSLYPNLNAEETLFGQALLVAANILLQYKSSTAQININHIVDKINSLLIARKMCDEAFISNSEIHSALTCFIESAYVPQFEMLKEIKTKEGTFVISDAQIATAIEQCYTEGWGWIKVLSHSYEYVSKHAWFLALCNQAGIPFMSKARLQKDFVTAVRENDSSRVSLLIEYQKLKSENSLVSCQEEMDELIADCFLAKNTATFLHLVRDKVMETDSLLKRNRALLPPSEALLPFEEMCKILDKEGNPLFNKSIRDKIENSIETDHHVRDVRMKMG